jgi:hypothetical protein
MVIYYRKIGQCKNPKGERPQGEGAKGALALRPLRALGETIVFIFFLLAKG